MSLFSEYSRENIHKQSMEVEGRATGYRVRALDLLDEAGGTPSKEACGEALVYAVLSAAERLDELTFRLAAIDDTLCSRLAPALEEGHGDEDDQERAFREWDEDHPDAGDEVREAAWARLFPDAPFDTLGKYDAYLNR